MTNETKPRWVNGELICSISCPHTSTCPYAAYNGVMSVNPPCVPALRQQRDKAQHRAATWKRLAKKLHGKLYNALRCLTIVGDEGDRDAGLLADLADQMFEDPNRAEDHGYNGMQERVDELLRAEKALNGKTE